MCGISAIVTLPEAARSAVNGSSSAFGSETKDVLTRQMQASLDNIDHRGPDSRGVWISDDNEIVLGHARLAINDLSPSGSQPLHSADGLIHAIVNGELYDFEKLKAELSHDHGYQFLSNCDSEIVVALYQVHGLEFLQHLRGEFALCIYDGWKKVFIAARDRYGIKPLFWTRSQNRLLIAAEVKAFLPLDWQPEWDVGSLVEAGWNFDDRTVFKDVKKVMPGCYMTCDESGMLEHHQYWDMEYPDKHITDNRSEEEMIKGVRDRLLEAVRIRLRADVPVGVYLSGGIDSSVIAGLVTHLTKEQGREMGSLPSTDRVSCFCVAFDKTSGFDESDVAERTADFLGVQMHKQIMTEEAFASRFADATWHCEHHNPDLNFIGKYALSEVPRQKGFKVVLTGEGADEIFTGYHIFLPDVLREPDVTSSSAMPEADRERLFAASEAETNRYYAQIGADSSSAIPEGRKKLNNISTLASMAAFIPPVFSPWVASTLHPQNPQDVIANAIPPEVITKMQQKWHPINTAQYVWTKNHLPNQFMSCLGDRTEMAHSIEGRTPFLDHHLTSYVNSIPPSLKMRYTPTAESQGDVTSYTTSPTSSTSSQFTAKYILREAMKPFVTEEIYTRVKHPYSAPLRYEEGGPLHRMLEELITEENVGELGFVDWEVAKTLLGRAFGREKEALAMRLSFVVAQWVVLGKRFGIRRAVPDEQ